MAENPESRDSMARLTDVTCTLDTHFPFQIFFSSFWLDKDDKPVPAFTTITSDMGPRELGPGEGGPSVDEILAAAQKQVEGLIKKTAGIKNTDPAGILAELAERAPESILAQIATRAQAIMVSRVHVRNDIHTAYAPFRRNLPGVDEFDGEQVSIPVGWWVTDEDRERVVKLIEEWAAL